MLMLCDMSMLMLALSSKYHCVQPHRVSDMTVDSFYLIFLSMILIVRILVNLFQLTDVVCDDKVDKFV